MPLKYKYLSQEEQDDLVASALIQREKEHHNYELNRLNYEAILSSLSDLPEEFPAHLKQFRGINGEALAAAISGEDYLLAVKLQFRDRVRLLLATTISEQQKVEHVYYALEKQLPEGERRLAAISRSQAQEELLLTSRPAGVLRLVGSLLSLVKERLSEDNSKCLGSSWREV